jgi:hypothetical protein
MANLCFIPCLQQAGDRIPQLRDHNDLLKIPWKKPACFATFSGLMRLIRRMFSTANPKFN